MFWFVAIAMALLASVAIVAALLKPGRFSLSSLERNLGVYRRQLQEINQDLSKNAIGENEAEQARLEVSRRMLRVSRSDETVQAEAPRFASLTLSVLVFLILVPGSAAVYLAVGSNGYLDQPLRSRIESASEAYADRPAQSVYLARLANDPDQSREVDVESNQTAAPSVGGDGVAAEVGTNRIASLRTQFRHAAKQGNLLRATEIQEQINKLLGSNATQEDRIRLVELYVGAAGGLISPEAEAELIAVLELDPDNLLASYYLGLLALQIGRPDQALATWVGVLQKSDPGDDLHLAISENLPFVAELAGVDLQRLLDRIASQKPGFEASNPDLTSPGTN